MRECETERTQRATSTCSARALRQAQPLQKQCSAGARAAWALLASAVLSLPSARLLAQPAAEPAPEAKPVVGAPAGPEPAVHATTPSAEPALAEPTPVTPAPEPPPPPPPPPASNMPTL